MPSAAACVRLACLGLLALGLASVAGPAEARSRKFCEYQPFYGGFDRDCGGHLEPFCTSGPACDAGHNSYSGSPFPITIDCPTIQECGFLGCVTIADVPDVTVNGGCYDRRPTCADCGGPGEIPCPVEAEPICDAGCNDGLTQNPTTTLCEVPGTPGGPCGPGFPCSAGLTCDPLSFTCIGPAGPGESCALPWVKCAPGLQCTLALECSHEPARLGETCDVTAPCGEGLFCQVGIPQRCKERRKPGEGCSAFNPCVEGASCEICLAEDCVSPLQCFPGNNGGQISEDLCRAFFDPEQQLAANLTGITTTVGAGVEGAIGAGGSFELGVAYGPDDAYGCYATDCVGVNLDASIESFLSFGLYTSFEAVGGFSWVSFVESETPGETFNFSASQIFTRESDDDVTPDEFVGTAATFALGFGPDIIPISGGVYLCDTSLDPVDAPPLVPGPPAPIIVASPEATGFGALRFDGSNDALAVRDVGALAALEMDDVLTLEAWILPEEPGQDAAILSKEGEYQLLLLGGELTFALANAEPGWVSTFTGIVPQPFRWTHVALVYADSMVRIFVDGALAYELPATGSIGDFHPGENEFRIGHRQRSSSFRFRGHIDEVRVWERALDESDVRAGLLALSEIGGAAPVAAWRFNERSGNTLRDDGPGGFDLALDELGAGSAPQRVADQRRRLGVALYFDGADDHVAVDDPEALAGLVLDDALTLEAWIRPYGPGSGAAGGTVVSKEGEYSLGRAADGRIRYALANASPGWSVVTTDAVAPQDQWSHVALVYDADAGEARVYLGGALVDARPASGSLGDADPGAAQLRIGGREQDELGGSDERFHGVIDEVRVWRTARDASQIESSWRGVVPSDVPSLVGYWRFDEGGLGVAFDVSNGRGHGLLGSGRAWESPRAVEAEALAGYPVEQLEWPTTIGCGLGFEAAFLVPLWAWASRRLRARRG